MALNFYQIIDTFTNTAVMLNLEHVEAIEPREKDGVVAVRTMGGEEYIVDAQLFGAITVHAEVNFFSFTQGTPVENVAVEDYEQLNGDDIVTIH